MLGSSFDDTDGDARAVADQAEALRERHRELLLALPPNPIVTRITRFFEGKFCFFRLHVLPMLPAPPTRCLCARGTPEDYDLSRISGAEGNVGILYEHSPAEGPPVAALSDFIVNHASICLDSPVRSPHRPEALVFATDTQAGFLAVHSPEFSI